MCYCFVNECNPDSTRSNKVMVSISFLLPKLQKIMRVLLVNKLPGKVEEEIINGFLPSIVISAEVKRFLSSRDLVLVQPSC